LYLPSYHRSYGPEDETYGKGVLDVAFVMFYILVWTLVRAVAIEHFLKPLAKRMGAKEALFDRFGEQGWLVMYYTPSFLIGTVCLNILGVK
jgi:acyl-CoA-dependent ceramide synthase